MCKCRVRENKVHVISDERESESCEIDDVYITDLLTNSTTNSDDSSSSWHKTIPNSAIVPTSM